jgi:hypothetical protein
LKITSYAALSRLSLLPGFDMNSGARQQSEEVFDNSFRKAKVLKSAEGVW